MPRYDDRYSTTRLYVGRLSSRTRSRDLERLFSRYGRIRDVDMKYDYAFVDFSDPRDADDARYSLDGREVDGSRLIVEFARGTPRGSREYAGRSSREYVGRGPPPGSGRCFNCGIDGHWARDCKAGDWKNKCYRCGERGHIERNCQNSPRKMRPRRSYSRSPRRSRSRSPSYNRSPSYSRSRSPPRRERITRRGGKRSRSGSMSPEPKRAALATPSRSPTPEDVRSERSPSPEPKNAMVATLSRRPIPQEAVSATPSRSPTPEDVRSERSPSPRAGTLSRSPTPQEAVSATPSRSPTSEEAPASERNSPSPKKEISATEQHGLENESPRAVNQSPKRDDAMNYSPSEADDGCMNGTIASPYEHRVPVEEEDDD